MKTDKILNIIDEHLQEVNDNTEERVKRIKTFLEYLNYNLRLTELSDEEKQSFVGSMDGAPLSPEMKKTMDECKKKSTEKEYNHYIEMWARSIYFRRCDWLQYLHGETNEKPFVQNKVLK